MKAFAFVAALVAPLCAMPAYAQDRAAPAAWKCFDSMEQLGAFETDGAVRLNNVSIRETSDMMFGVSRITFKASIANRSRQRIVASVELVASAGAASLFAISARPAFDAVNPGDNGELNQSIFVEKGTLAKAVGGCIRFTAFPTK